MNVGWIGLGNMGGPMTANLVKAGHSVKGFDLSEPAKAAAAESGVTVVGSVAEAVEGADLVFTMLPAGSHARSVITGPDGVLASAPSTALIVDSSTIDIETAAANRDFAGGFSTALLRKDLGLALQAGEETGTDLSFAQGVADRLDTIIERGDEGKDCSILVQLLESDGESTNG